MHHMSRFTLATAGVLVCTTASAFQLDGKLPMYPHGRNMNDMPASAIAMGVPPCPRDRGIRVHGRCLV